jgi:type IV pilus assembly protein PilV
LHECGFTLLEALIALLVLAIGLLGLAGLQVRGLSYNHDAFVRSQASFMAYDLMERMRIRKLNSITDGTKVSNTVAFTVQPAANPSCPTANRNSAKIPEELQCWYKDLEDSLPGAKAKRPTVIQTAGNATAVDPSDDQFQIAICWLDRQAAAEAAVNPICSAAVDVKDGYVKQVWTFQP